NVRFKTKATNGATTKPMQYIANKVNPSTHHGRPGLINAAISSKYTGSRAEQLISGATRIVAKRSRRFSITRVAMIPGTAQATDDSSGMNDLPLRPARDMSRAIKKAARAM